MHASKYGCYRSIMLFRPRTCWFMLHTLQTASMTYHSSIQKCIVYKIVRHFSFTPNCLQLFVCTCRIPTDIFFFGSISPFLLQLCLRVVHSSYRTLAVCVSLCQFFFVFSSHGKKLLCVVCCCCCYIVFFSSMPMAFYYGFFGNCSWLFQVNSFVYLCVVCSFFRCCFVWLKRGEGEQHITYKWLPSK